MRNRVRAFLDVRFAQVEREAERRASGAQGYAEAAVAAMHERFDRVDGAHGSLSTQQSHLSRGQERVADAVEGLQSSALEIFDLFGRTLGGVSAQVDEVSDQLTKQEEMQSHLAALSDQIEAISRKVGSATFEPDRYGDVTTLDDYHAAVVNWASGHLGWASQAGLWFNPPVVVAHGAGGVRETAVNERIGELPFVFGALADLPVGSRILDVGCAESTVALSLATMGHLVTGVDLRPYPIGHPNLSIVVGQVESLEVEQPFDVVISLSTLEHIGIRAYGGREEPDADLDAMTRMRELCRPDGLLVFTAPYGLAETTELQRCYDDERLERLMTGWTVDTREYLVRRDPLTWERTADKPEPDREAVVLITARRAG